MEKHNVFETLAAKRAEAQLGGGQARIDAQHAKKKADRTRTLGATL